MRSMTTLMRLGGLAAIASALLALLSFVLYLVIVGGSRISEAATSAAFFLPSGAQLLAIALLLLGLVAYSLDRLRCSVLWALRVSFSPCSVRRWPQGRLGAKYSWCHGWRKWHPPSLTKARGPCLRGSCSLTCSLA